MAFSHTMPIRAGALAAVALAGLLGRPTAGAEAEGQPGAFPFFPAADGRAADSAVNVRFLNGDGPAGARGRIVVRDGVFVESDTGQRVRFMSTNLNGPDFLAADPALYDPWARRMAESGFNLVRLHHMDNTWATTSGGSLWSKERPDDRTVPDPGQMDKLFRLIDACKRHGIYVNINLKVSRRLSAADGMPPDIAKVKSNHQKGLDFFHRVWIDKQKDFARRVLAAVNPHTGLSAVDDPAVAFVEINNENSILGATWDASKTLRELPDVFKNDLAAQWTEWLRRRHGDDGTLLAAWGGGVAFGPDLLSADTPWRHSAQGGAALALTPGAARPGCAPDVTVDIKNVTPKAYQAQVDVAGLTLRGDALHTLSFRMRGDKARAVSVGLRRDGPPYDHLGFASYPNTRTDWVEHRHTFIAKEAPPGQTKIAFVVGQATGRVEIADLRLREGAEDAGLAEGESLDAGIGLPGNMTPGQQRDWNDFLAERDKAFADEMAAFLRTELGVRANIVCSQIEFSTLSGFAREEGMDYTDSHSYWDHPKTPGGWGSAQWSIRNQSQLFELAEGSGALGRLARFRTDGRPFSVSEYDHCAPNDYAAELYPLLAVFALRQDWDALHTFSHGHVDPAVHAGHIPAWFDQSRHPAKWGFAPGAAVLWRLGAFGPAPTGSVLHFPRPFHRFSGSLAGAWGRGWPGFAPDLWNHRIAVSYEAADPAEVRPAAAVAARPGAETVALRLLNGQPVFTAHAPTASVVTGFVGGLSLALDRTAFSFDASTRHASALWVSLDGLPLASSKRSLLTVMARAENTDMRWNKDRTGLGKNWGRAPTRILPATGTASLLPDDGAPRTVHALDEQGRRRAALPVTRGPGGRITFPVGAEAKTLWFEVVSE